MRPAPQSPRKGSGLIAGSIAGIAGGLAMIPFFVLSAVSVGMPAMAVLASIGLAFGADSDGAIALGIVMHLAASVLIGMIFGIVTGMVDRLRITSYKKGVGLGLIAGMVAFAVLFIPTTMSPPSRPDQQGSSMLIGVIEHLVYGAVLGAVTARLVLNAGKRRSEGIFECSTCRARFTSAQDLDEHVRVAHHGVAA